jgi:hypothetical protein
MAPESSRKSLPFEPGKRKGKSESSGAQPKAAPKDNGVKGDPGKKRPKSRQVKDAAIPEVVSRRMLKRMVIFSGVPTFAGVATFFVSYLVLINGVVELPSYFVLFATLGCFGLGVLGLSYGALSASWDEDRLGHWFGLDEFKVNFGRLTGAWGSKADS